MAHGEHLGDTCWGSLGSLRGYLESLAEAQRSIGHLQGHIRGAPVLYSISISLHICG